MSPGGGDGGYDHLSDTHYADAMGSGVYQDHHIFPQQFEDHWAAYDGFNHHEFTISLPSDWHSAVHSSGWNEDWQSFFDDNPSATLQDVQDHAAQMLEDYGLLDHYLHEWRSER